MKKIRTPRRLLAAILGFSLAQAFAAPPTAPSVERLLALTRAESMMDSMYLNLEQVMRQSMQQMAAQQQLSEPQRRALDTMPGKLVQLMREELNWAALKPSYVTIYQETFEQDEIDALITFYQSPAGQSMVAKMPLVIQKSMMVSQERMRTLMPRIAQAMQQAVKDAQATQP